MQLTEKINQKYYECPQYCDFCKGKNLAVLIFKGEAFYCQACWDNVCK